MQTPLHPSLTRSSSSYLLGHKLFISILSMLAFKELMVVLKSAKISTLKLQKESKSLNIVPANNSHTTAVYTRANTLYAHRPQKTLVSPPFQISCRPDNVCCMHNGLDNRILMLHSFHEASTGNVKHMQMLHHRAHVPCYMELASRHHIIQ